MLSGGVTSDICVYPPDLFESEGVALVNRKSVIYIRKLIKHVPTLEIDGIVDSQFVGNDLILLHNAGY